MVIIFPIEYFLLRILPEIPTPKTFVSIYRYSTQCIELGVHSALLSHIIQENIRAIFFPTYSRALVITFSSI